MSTRILNDAIRYWEPRRVVYNLILTIVALAWLGLTWPHFRPALTLSALTQLLILAGLANVCYCAAYVADIAMQLSLVGERWQRWRWRVWLTGTLLAVLIENYWIADEIYPFVR